MVCISSSNAENSSSFHSSNHNSYQVITTIMIIITAFVLTILITIAATRLMISRLDWILDVGLLAVGVTALVLGVSNTHCGAE